MCCRVRINDDWLTLSASWPPGLQVGWLANVVFSQLNCSTVNGGGVVDISSLTVVKTQYRRISILLIQQRSFSLGLGLIQLDPAS